MMACRERAAADSHGWRRARADGDTRAFSRCRAASTRRHRQPFRAPRTSKLAASIHSKERARLANIGRRAILRPLAPLSSC